MTGSDRKNVHTCSNNLILDFKRRANFTKNCACNDLPAAEDRTTAAPMRWPILSSGRVTVKIKTSQIQNIPIWTQKCEKSYPINEISQCQRACPKLWESRGFGDITPNRLVSKRARYMNTKSVSGTLRQQSCHHVRQVNSKIKTSRRQSLQHLRSFFADKHHLKALP